jgi:hypothetical protein
MDPDRADAEAGCIDGFTILLFLIFAGLFILAVIFKTLRLT